MISRRMIGVSEQFAKSVIAASNVRAFYNDSGSATFFAEQLHERHKTKKILDYAANLKKKSEKEPFRVQTWMQGPKPGESDYFIVSYLQSLRKTKEMRKLEDQRKATMTHINLGIDLGAAYFIVNRGGKIKFKGQTEWIDHKTVKKMPTEYDPNYFIEGMDFNRFDVYYEGLDNIVNLAHLKLLSFNGCPSFDDWCLDKISAEFPVLEYLDISDCQKITERGLECLYRMPNLKTLIVTNYSHTAEFELMCLMLEDVNPYLKIEIRQPKRRIIREM